MVKFLEKYEYSWVSDVLIREDFPISIANAVHDNIEKYYNSGITHKTYSSFNQYLWREVFFHKGNYENSFSFLNILESDQYQWFEKLKILQEFLSFFKKDVTNKQDGSYSEERVDAFVQFCKDLNFDFEKRNYSYRIVDCYIVEVTSKQEAESIEEALQNENKGVKIHLHDALTFLSVAKEKPNYRSSIQQSISAVEACCREITKENTLGKALDKLVSTGIKINKELKEGFGKIYNYTNASDGIRHALMDDSNPPTSDEAVFMLVACSAFINYLTKKKSKIE